MKILDIAYLLKNDIKFSLREVEKSILLIVAGAIAIVIVAVLTFEGEYFTARSLETLLEYIGFLNDNWVAGHQILFLHQIQLVFIITFILEIRFIISRYMRGWTL